jgi:hypothetical protein
MNIEDIKNKCEYCASRMLHLHYLLIKHHKKFHAFDECLEDTRNSIVEYHENWGKNAFMSSERTTDEYVSEENIRWHTQRIWDADQTTVYDVQPLPCHHIDDLLPETTKPDFIQ